MAKAPRKDPTPKRESNEFDQTQIRAGRDPKRVYVFASPRAINMGVRHREALGWVIEHRRPDGPKLLIGETAKEGEPIEFMDCVLMSIDRETWQKHEQYGVPGNSHGQDYFDRKDAQIRKRRSGIHDGMPRSSAAMIQNKTDQIGDLSNWE